MERVDHVHVVQVGGGGLVGQIDRVLQGNVPDGEGLKLGVARAYAVFVLVVELGEARRHLAAAGTRRGDDDERVRRLDILVAAKALVAHDVATSEG